MTTYRRPGEDIIAGELAKLLRQEMAAGMRGMFEDIFKGSGFGQGQGLNVVIHNNAGVSVSARETGTMNQKQLEITIDQMVANSLMQGRQTSGVLRSLFGLAPNLIGR